ncbi:phage terminase small subunit [Geomicrobium sp. JCM 19039]|uniref:phage terminase small subunit n=1 Tax=Geomicrobium sp. JCM 19039 TaxID=1460636 RepID=UPI00045F1375|nr:phage terminase small subunit [Geomicrobium sp. JCM 19039]GAK11383.1 phage-related terminase small subunit homolog YqaS [Geomicrobium sp. JCM 19039]
MARARSEKREKAFQLWLDSNGEMKLKDIADELDCSPSQIRKWKNQDQWDEKLNGNVTNQKGNVTKRRGAPKGNQYAVGNTGGAPKGTRNAVGNSGGSAPLGNKNAVTSGEYESIILDALPDDEKALFGLIDADPLNQLDEQIRLLTIGRDACYFELKKLKAVLRIKSSAF